MLLFCHGMIRSGSSVQYKLARALVEAAGVGRDEGCLSPDDMDRRSDALAGWAAAPRYHIVQLREPHPAVTRFVNAGQAKICYAYRDIRDVAVLARRSFGCRGDALLERLQGAVDIYYVVHTYDGVLSQQYEELVGAIDEATDQMVAFLDLNIPADVRERIAERIRRQEIAPAATKPTGSNLGHVLALVRALKGRRRQPADRGYDVPLGARRDLPVDEASRIEMRFSGWLRDAGYDAPM